MKKNSIGGSFVKKINSFFILIFAFILFSCSKDSPTTAEQPLDRLAVLDQKILAEMTKTACHRWFLVLSKKIRSSGRDFTALAILQKKYRPQTRRFIYLPPFRKL